MCGILKPSRGLEMLKTTRKSTPEQALAALLCFFVFECTWNDIINVNHWNNLHFRYVCVSNLCQFCNNYKPRDSLSTVNLYCAWICTGHEYFPPDKQTVQREFKSLLIVVSHVRCNVCSVKQFLTGNLSFRDKKTYVVFEKLTVFSVSGVHKEITKTN